MFSGDVEVVQRHETFSPEGRGNAESHCVTIFFPAGCPQ